MKFRKWQKVRCVTPEPWDAGKLLNRETEYVVLECRTDAIKVLADNFEEAWFYDERFVAIEDSNNVGTEMTKEEYLKFHEAFCADMVRITKAKNHDYTGNNPNPFANFEGVENANVCSTEQGFLVRMHDKMARINSFVQKGVLQVADESIEDTLKDLANYSALLAGYIKSKKQEARNG